MPQTVTSPLCVIDVVSRREMSLISVDNSLSRCLANNSRRISSSLPSRGRVRSSRPLVVAAGASSSESPTLVDNSDDDAATRSRHRTGNEIDPAGSRGRAGHWPVWRVRRRQRDGYIRETAQAVNHFSSTHTGSPVWVPGLYV